MDASAPAELLTVLVRLRQALAATPFPLDAAGVEHARSERAALIQQLEDYVIPRLLQIEAPLLVVVGGSTGAGKSTLVNSLVGRRVTESGVLRPTTRSPVLVHNPADAMWFGRDRLLPDLARTDRLTTYQRTLQLVAATEIPAGLAIIDAPDVDSVEAQNRLLAGQLLSAADLWIFVTSAARYADRVPWEFLQSAERRSTAVAVVLDRTVPRSVREVSSHLARMLTAKGLGESPLFTVPESPVDDDGMLPPKSVAPIRHWLDRLAVDEYARMVVVRKTLNGTVRSITPRVHVLADAQTAQVELAGQLRADAERTYGDSLRTLASALADGSMLTGEVSVRWQELVETGELDRSLEDRVSRRRDRLSDGDGKRPSPARTLAAAVGAGLSTMIGEHAASAAERAVMSWRSLPAGRRLIERGPDSLGRPLPDFEARVATTVRDWQNAVLELVRRESADRRATARFLASGVHGLSVALTMVVLDRAAAAGVSGLSDPEGAAAGRTVLDAVFGDQAAHRLTEQAATDLTRRVAELWSTELQRYLGVLESDPPGPYTGGSLHDLAHEVDDSRVVGAPV
jgi:GTPase SAR1 family protein